MPHPLWKGNLSFGLVSIPVVFQSAEARLDLHSTLLDSRDKSRIRYERVNEETGEEVLWNQIVKGFEYDKGNYVVLPDSDFKRAAVEATRTVEIEDFVDVDEVSPVYFDKPYYLLPGKGGEKGYEPLREALKRSNRAGVAKVVIRTRQYLSAVLAREEALMLMALRFRQELWDFAEVAAEEMPRIKAQEIAPKELELAGRLIEAMGSEWRPAKYHDEYCDALVKWMEQKAKAGGRALPAPEEEREEAAPPTSNFMEPLRKSVEGADSAKARPRAAAHKNRTVRRRAG